MDNIRYFLTTSLTRWLRKARNKFFFISTPEF